MDSLIDLIIAKLTRFPSTERIFNQYAHHKTEIEGEEAPAIRRDNLRKYLETMASVPGRDIWLFEAPSQNGAVRTGVPQTSASLLERRSRDLAIDPPLAGIKTKSSADVAQSATSERVEVFWRKLAIKPVIWNAVALHTRKPNGSNRKPNMTGIRQHNAVVGLICELCQPHRFVACGESAWKAMRILGYEAREIPHPVAPRSPSFKLRMTELYGH